MGNRSVNNSGNTANTGGGMHLTPVNSIESF